MPKRKSDTAAEAESKRRKREEDAESDSDSSDDDRSTDGSDNGSDLEDFIVKDEDDDDEDVAADSSENEVAVVTAEAKKLTDSLQSTVVGGRSLRNRETLKKPETYFDHEAFERLNADDEKREMISMLKKWASKGEYICPILKELNKKTDASVVEAEYRKAKAALDIPDTDDESEESEESEETGESASDYEEEAEDEEEVDDESDEEDDEDESEEDD